MGLGSERPTANWVTARPPTATLPTRIGTDTDWKAVSAGAMALRSPEDRRLPLGLGRQSMTANWVTARPPTATIPPASARTPTGRPLLPVSTAWL